VALRPRTAATSQPPNTQGCSATAARGSAARHLALDPNSGAAAASGLVRPAVRQRAGSRGRGRRRLLRSYADIEPVPTEATDDPAELFTGPTAWPEKQKKNAPPDLHVRRWPRGASSGSQTLHSHRSRRCRPSACRVADPGPALPPRAGRPSTASTGGAAGGRYAFGRAVRRGSMELGRGRPAATAASRPTTRRTGCSPHCCRPTPTCRSVRPPQRSGYPHEATAGTSMPSAGPEPFAPCMASALWRRRVGSQADRRAAAGRTTSRSAPPAMRLGRPDSAAHARRAAAGAPSSSAAPRRRRPSMGAEYGRAACPVPAGLPGPCNAGRRPSASVAGLLTLVLAPLFLIERAGGRGGRCPGTAVLRSGLACDPVGAQRARGRRHRPRRGRGRRDHGLNGVIATGGDERASRHRPANLFDWRRDAPYERHRRPLISRPRGPRRPPSHDPPARTSGGASAVDPRHPAPAPGAGRRRRRLRRAGTVAALPRSARPRTCAAAG
jgi:hypothetical protein